jgi:DNA-binding transcriptional LysR family regulator
MDIRHLRYFVAVAKTLNFGQAARDLHMSQPPLSKRIAELEEHLGIRLFERNSRNVSLTVQGRRLLPQAVSAIKAFDAAMRAARAAAPTNSRHLHIALPPETSRSVLMQVVSRLHKERVEVSITEASTAEQRRLLDAGEIDVGVLRHPFDATGLKVSSALMQPLGVLMHCEHPLATKRRLRLIDLQPFPLVQFQRHLSPGLYDEILDICRVGGYVPGTIRHGIRMTAALLTAEAAVTFTPERLLRRRGQSGTGELTWKPLEGDPVRTWTSAVCRRSDWDPLTRRAVTEVLAALEAHERWVPSPRPAGRRSRHQAAKS